MPVVSDGDFPASVVDVVVAVAAYQYEIGQIGCAAVGPVDDVVHLAELCCLATFDAAAVSDGHSCALLGGREADGPAHREWDSIVVEDDRVEVGVAREQSGEAVADWPCPGEVERPMWVVIRTFRAADSVRDEIFQGDSDVHTRR